MLDRIEKSVTTITELKKFTSNLAITICDRFKLSDETKCLIDAKLQATEFLQRLINEKFYHDAIQFLAHGLPKREAIWWAYLCAEQTELSDEADNDILNALNIIKTWIYEPKESTRRLAEKASEKLTFKTAVSWAAIAVFWSGGSITPPDQPAVEPNEFLSAKAVAGSVMLAAVSKNPEKIDENYQHFIAQAIHIANGGNGRI